MTWSASVWEIRFTPRAAKALKRCDRPVQKRIFSYLRQVAELEDPRSRGKALVGSKAGLWRWRVGDWRIIASIEDEKVYIQVVDVDHRSAVYG